jgi:hypothetical protein
MYTYYEWCNNSHSYRLWLEWICQHCAKCFVCIISFNPHWPLSSRPNMVHHISANPFSFTLFTLLISSHYTLCLIPLYLSRNLTVISFLSCLVNLSFSLGYLNILKYLTKNFSWFHISLQLQLSSLLLYSQMSWNNYSFSIFFLWY